MRKEEYIAAFEKYLRNEATRADIERLISAIKTDEKTSLFFETEMSKMSNNMSEETRTRIYDNITQAINIDETTKPKQSLNIYYKPILKWVAVLMLPLISALFMYLYLQQKDFSNDMPVTVSAANGEKAEVLMADGSKIWLNSGSKLTYNNLYNKKERRVVLDGEAFFEVYDNKELPFIVEAGDMEVQALGTSFNVNAYADDQHITSVLLEGKIKVQVKGEEHILNHNERVVLHKGLQVVTRDTVNAADFAQWKHGHLYFKNNSFEEIAQTLARAFNVDIRFASDQLRPIRFSGTLGNSSIRNALDILSLTSSMRYEMNGTTIELYYK